MAEKVTTADMPPKVTNDELAATEVERIRAVINLNADELEGVGEVATAAAAKAAEYIGQASGRTLFQLGSALRDKTVLRLRRLIPAGLGQLEPLPSGSAIDTTTGVLSYPGTDEVLLVLVDGALTVPLARTPAPGASPAPGAGLQYTAAPLAARQPVFELSPDLAALGKGRLRLLISPASTPPPVPSGGFPYSFPASIP